MFSGAILYAILYFFFRNHRVSRAEAACSKPWRLFGMDVWPKRQENDVTIPKNGLVCIGVIFLIESWFLFLKL